jgi:hypothetical protein
VKIRHEQMAMFAKCARETFITTQVKRLRSIFSKETEALDSVALKSLIEDAFDCANSYGVVNEQDLELFLDCTLLLARDFDRDPQFPWAGRSLNDANMTGTEKMSLIHSHLLFRGV